MVMRARYTRAAFDAGYQSVEFGWRTFRFSGASRQYCVLNSDMSSQIDRTLNGGVFGAARNAVSNSNDLSRVSAVFVSLRCDEMFCRVFCGDESTVSAVP